MKSSLAELISIDRRSPEHESGERTTRFERDVMPLRPELLRAATRLTGRRCDAEDLVQDVLLRAWRSFATFRPGTNTRAWLHQILRNTWINDYRSRQRRLTEVPMEDHAVEIAGEAAYGVPSPDAIVVAAQPDSEVLSAMAGLSEDFRMVVYLADVEGYPCAAIAEMMGTPIGTVMSRLHRARRQLRVSLGGTVRRRRLVTAA